MERKSSHIWELPNARKGENCRLLSFLFVFFFFYINPKTSAAIKSAIMYVNCVQIYRVERGITLSSNSKIGYPREIQQIGDTT